MKQHATMAVVAVLALMQSACSPMKPMQTAADQYVWPPKETLLHEIADREIICMVGEDCDLKWGRATRWVDRHNTQGIRTLNDHLIQTHLVASADGAIRVPEYTVIRYKKSKGIDIISFRSYCERGFACEPSSLKRRADFVGTVMGPPAGVTYDGHTYVKIVPLDDN